MNTQTPISTLVGKIIAEITVTTADEASGLTIMPVITFLDANGNVLFQVNAHRIFDQNGRCFNLNATGK
jgi:hypothetical protein